VEAGGVDAGRIHYSMWDYRPLQGIRWGSRRGAGSRPRRPELHHSELRIALPGGEREVNSDGRTELGW
jgi:hypothetical protein